MKRPQARARRRIELLVYAVGIAALAGYLAVAALRPLNPARNNDVFIHLTSGRLILEEGRVQRTDRYSFTAPGARYVPHEWAAQVLYALGERVGGIPGVIATARLLPALALLASLVLALRNAGAGRGTTIGLAAVALAASRHRLLARPDLLALVLFVTCLWLLLRHRRLSREGRPSRAVWWLIPVELLWVNVHGSFPLGVALTLVFAGQATLERLPRARARIASLLLGLAAAGAALVIAATQPPSFGGPAAAILALAALALLVDVAHPWLARPGAAREAPGLLVLLACAQALVLLLNPTGAHLVLFPLEFGSSSGAVARHVIEWRPIVETLTLPHWAQRFAPTGLAATFLYLGLALLAVAGAWRRDRLEGLPIGLLLGLALLPLRHTRWLALFAVGAAPALGLLLRRGPARLGAHPPVRAGPALLVLAAGAALVPCMAALAAVAFDPVIVAATAAVALAGAGALLGQGNSPRQGASLALAVTAAVVLVLLSVGPGIPEKAGQPWRPGLFVRPVAPVPAIGFLRAASLGGRLCTEYAWAGYAIHALWPSIRVNIDSRSEVYGERGLEDWILAHRDPELARAQLAGCDLALVGRRPLRHGPDGPSVSALLDHLVETPRWRLLYYDATSALFAVEREGVTLPPALDTDGLRASGAWPEPAGAP